MAATAAQKRGMAKRYCQRKAIVDALKATSCADCGVTYPPCVMDFDHVRGHKEFNVASHLRDFSLAKLLAEIEKCEVVCSNCHRLRTTYRRAEAKS